MNAFTQGLFTNIPIFAVLAAMTVMGIIGYKNITAKMEKGFLSVDHRLQDHDKEIKGIKHDIKGIKKRLSKVEKMVTSHDKILCEIRAKI